MTRDTVTPDPLTETQALRPARLEIIDTLRGLVIVLMILDHVRDFFSRDGLLFAPTDLARTTVALFATRWVTHLCAPTFVALAGVAIFLQRARGKRGMALVRFLVTRGLWLIALELTWVSFGFRFCEPCFLLQVIWAIGASFILLAPLTMLPPPAVLGLGLAIVGGHVLFAGVAPQGPLGALWTLAMRPGQLGDAYVPYPALPWFGIMACGYGAGGLFLLEPARRDRALVGRVLSAQINITGVSCPAVCHRRRRSRRQVRHRNRQGRRLCRRRSPCRRDRHGRLALVPMEACPVRCSGRPEADPVAGSAAV